MSFIHVLFCVVRALPNTTNVMLVQSLALVNCSKRAVRWCPGSGRWRGMAGSLVFLWYTCGSSTDARPGDGIPGVQPGLCYQSSR